MAATLSKALLAVLSPRDWKPAAKAIEAIDYVDQFWVKYHPPQKAHNEIRRFFLNHDYEIVIYCPDDIIPSYYSVAQLVRDLENNPDIEVVSGVCNVQKSGEALGLINVSMKQVASSEEQKVTSIAEYEFLKATNIFQAQRIIRVWFVGFALTAVKRSVVEKVRLRSWTTPGQEQYDLAFSYDCWRRGIKLYADLDVVVPHFGPMYHNLLVGIEEPYCRFAPNKRKTSRKLWWQKSSLSPRASLGCLWQTF